MSMNWVILWQYLTLLMAHWFGDFVLQTHWQASNKSKRLDALSLHVGTYTAVLFLSSCLIFYHESFYWLTDFALVNGALHFCTDFVTSRISSKLWAKGEWHNFFVVIGLDQLIHQVTLGMTMWWFFT